MEYVTLGRTGLEVSRMCLGCMTYGEPERGSHPWTLGEEAARPFIQRALELGINFFDTANVYSDELTDVEVAELQQPYVPHAVAGFS
jgi:1-deoxyxylulose-5-phosphate synthase